MSNPITSSQNATRQEVYTFLQEHTTVFGQKGRKILDEVGVVQKTSQAAKNVFQNWFNSGAKGPEVKIDVKSKQEGEEILGKTLRGVVVQTKDAWNAGWPTRSQSGEYFPDPGAEKLKEPNKQVDDATQKIYEKLRKSVGEDPKKTTRVVSVKPDPRADDL